MPGKPRPPTTASRRLGHRVQEEREAHNVTRATLARALDISESVLWKIEAGQVALTAARALKIATYLQITISRLYGERADGAKVAG